VEPVRAFIAIQLPNLIKSALSELQERLKIGGYTSVKWVAPDSIHLTIKFLGDIDSGAVPTITEAISEASRDILQFQLELTEAGAFPNLRTPRVVWVGIGGDTDKLTIIRENLERALIPSGFVPEKRAFSPHLTLGRVRERASSDERRRLGEAIATIELAATPSFTVDSISLMRSILTRERALYSCLSSIDLPGG